MKQYLALRDIPYFTSEQSDTEGSQMFVDKEVKAGTIFDMETVNSMVWTQVLVYSFLAIRLPDDVTDKDLFKIGLKHGVKIKR